MNLREALSHFIAERVQTIEVNKSDIRGQVLSDRNVNALLFAILLRA